MGFEKLRNTVVRALLTPTFRDGGGPGHLCRPCVLADMGNDGDPYSNRHKLLHPRFTTDGEHPAAIQTTGISSFAPPEAGRMPRLRPLRSILPTVCTKVAIHTFLHINEGEFHNLAQSQTLDWPVFGLTCQWRHKNTSKQCLPVLARRQACD